MTNHQTQNCEWKSQDIFYKLESEPTFMRTSQRICEVSSKYQSEILAVDRFNNEYANAKSILDIMPFLASNFILIYIYISFIPTIAFICNCSPPQVTIWGIFILCLPTEPHF